MKKKVVALTLAVVMAATSLAGCGSGTQSASDSTGTVSEDTGGEAENTEQEAEGSAADSDEEINLEVMITSLNDSADGPFLLEVIEEFENMHPNVHIEPIAVAMNDLYTQLLTMATAGNLPDVFTMQDAYMAKAVEMEMVADMTDLLGEEWLNGTLPVAVEGCKVDDMLAFMPWQNNTGAMIYRKDLFEEKSLEIPETWDEFIEVAKALTEDLDGDGVVDRYGATFCGTRNDSAESRFQSFAMTFGAWLVKEENGEMVTEIDSEQFRDAMEFFINAAVNEGIMPDGFVETGYSEAYTMCAADQACMFFGASNVFGAMFNANPDMKDKWGSFPMPHAEGVDPITTFGTLGMSISSTSEHPEMAAEFLKFLTNKENSIAWNEVTGRLPCQIEALDEIIAGNELFKGFADSSDFAVLLPTFEGTAELRDICGECWQTVVAEGVSLDDALAAATSKAEEVMSKY